MSADSCRLIYLSFYPHISSPIRGHAPRISPPADRPIKKALPTQINPGIVGGEIRHVSLAVTKRKLWEYKALYDMYKCILINNLLRKRALKPYKKYFEFLSISFSN